MAGGARCVGVSFSGHRCCYRYTCCFISPPPPQCSKWRSLSWAAGSSFHLTKEIGTPCRKCSAVRCSAVQCSTNPARGRRQGLPWLLGRGRMSEVCPAVVWLAAQSKEPWGILLAASCETGRNEPMSWKAAASSGRVRHKSKCGGGAYRFSVNQLNVPRLPIEHNPGPSQEDDVK